MSRMIAWSEFGDFLTSIIPWWGWVIVTAGIFFFAVAIVAAFRAENIVKQYPFASKEVRALVWSHYGKIYSDTLFYLLVRYPFNIEGKIWDMPINIEGKIEDMPREWRRRFNQKKEEYRREQIKKHCTPDEFNIWIKRFLDGWTEESLLKLLQRQDLSASVPKDLKNQFGTDWVRGYVLIFGPYAELVWTIALPYATNELQSRSDLFNKEVLVKAISEALRGLCTPWERYESGVEPTEEKWELDDPSRGFDARWVKVQEASAGRSGYRSVEDPDRDTRRDLKRAQEFLGNADFSKFSKEQRPRNEEKPQRNEAMFAALQHSAERLKDIPVSGSTEQTLKIIREGRAGAMYGYEPTDTE